MTGRISGAILFLCGACDPAWLPPVPWFTYMMVAVVCGTAGGEFWRIGRKS